MAQRNPMNERYLGDGPQGKTRKSAAKLKPKTEAASSVHIAAKPTTKQERKAAAKKRDAQLAAKERERVNKQIERERKARIEAGEPAEPQKETIADKVKKFFAPPASATDAQSVAEKKALYTDEYKRLKAIYWGLMIFGVIAILASFAFNFFIPVLEGTWAMMVPMGLAYVAVISAIVLDYAKIRKMQKAHQKLMVGGMGSPKQQKHEQRKAEAAALLEEQKKAEKALKRANSKLPFRKKSTEEADLGIPDDDSSNATSDDTEE